jgi:hypothetical protein
MVLKQSRHSRAVLELTTVHKSQLAAGIEGISESLLVNSSGCNWGVTAETMGEAWGQVQ